MADKQWSTNTTAEGGFVFERLKVSPGEGRPQCGSLDSLRSTTEVRWRGDMLRKNGDSGNREVNSACGPCTKFAPPRSEVGIAS